MKLFKIITLFPDFFQSPLSTSLLHKGITSNLLAIDIIDLRKYSDNKFRRCDDYTYGGGSGMLLMPAPLFKAIESQKGEKTKVIYTSPSGMMLNQDLVKSLSAEEELCIICGHYEGVDQRVLDRYVDYEISIGDYILSGGEYAALVIIDAVARYIPGFMSNTNSLHEESFENFLLEYAQYTRPKDIDGWKVPDILLSGDHEKIREWRLKNSIEKTKRVRPDLYKRYIKLGEDK
ncbi:MAG: tRNA (guanosine(37)-N1)-methyltransferase TrmD [Spirochaetota bacterium]|nr:tRNA (guanosine(37)-N1)-methyltransferase TrmD [Spirochaetota bacterium]